MAVRKLKAASPEGAPAWMVTYGDMVTLLLTFFVLLLTFMEPKEEDLVQQLLQMLRQEFGYQGGVRVMPTDPVQMPKNIPLAEMIIVPINPEDLSPTDADGVRSQRPEVTNIREGEIYQKGGKLLFAELSAELTDEHRRQLIEYAAHLRGHTAMIEIRGHCSKRPVDGTAFADHIELSYRRARAVYDVLLAEGIDPNRMVTVAAATSRPVTMSGYNPDERRKNDLVEIVQRDKSVTEFQGP